MDFMVDNNDGVLVMDPHFLETFLNHREMVSYLHKQFSYWKTKSEQVDIESKLLIPMYDRLLASFDPPLPEDQTLGMKSKFEHLRLNCNVKLGYYTGHCVFIESHIKQQEVFLSTIGNPLPYTGDVQVPSPTNDKCLEIISILQQLFDFYQIKTQKMVRLYTLTADLHDTSIEWSIMEESLRDCIKLYKQLHEPKPDTPPKVDT
jgi:hypothetical protein